MSALCVRATRFAVTAARLVMTIAVGAGLVMALIALLVESIATWRDDRVLTRVGRAVDIGGRTLNISCMGEGSPTVIFESGHASPGYVWTPTQRDVAAITRACWYDRASLGWSDGGPDPNWGDAAARDLHALLTQADIRPPYVLVGHSFGGYIIRLFNDGYPGEAVGMVFVDAAQEDAGSIAGIPYRPPPPLPRPVVNTLSVVLPWFGLMRITQPAQGAPPPGWTAHEWDMLARLRRRHLALLADAHEGPEIETARRVRAARRWEDLPVVVLAMGRQASEDQGPTPGVLGGWVALQRSFAARARRSTFAVVSESGHGIPIEAPARIAAAVRDLVNQLRNP